MKESHCLSDSVGSVDGSGEIPFWLLYVSTGVTLSQDDTRADAGLAQIRKKTVRKRFDLTRKTSDDRSVVSDGQLKMKRIERERGDAVFTGTHARLVLKTVVRARRIGRSVAKGV